MSYSCWYDRRNPSVAQWDKPSALIQIILLGCGGLSISISSTKNSNDTMNRKAMVQLVESKYQTYF